MTPRQLPISEAALRLGIDYHQCRRLVLRGELKGGRDNYGRLFADARSVEKRLQDEAPKSAQASRGRHV